MLHLLLTAALAAEPAALPPQPDPGTVILVNPLGPVVAQVLMVAPLGDEFFQVRAFDLNARAHHAFSDRWALTIQADFTAGQLLVYAVHAGVRAGPRFSFGRQGLKGWGVSPFLLTGVTSMGAGDYPLANWANVGFGTEIGRLFVLRENLAIELGTGLYWTTNVAFSSSSELLGDEAPDPILGLKPLLTAAVGYAW